MTTTTQTYSRDWWLARLPAVGLSMLLLGMVGWGLTLPVPGDAQGYHARVVEASNLAPLQVGGWSGRDQFIAESAIELLQPNVIMSRWYMNPSASAALSSFSSATNRGLSAGVGVLVVQCKDARDLIGHWPPNCYPAAGNTQDRVEEKTWNLDGKTIPGREYWFSKQDRDGRKTVTVVQNFLLLPDGRISRDMETVVDAAGDYRVRYFGSAQVQFVSDGELEPQTRDALFIQFMRAFEPFIQTIGQGL